MSQRPLRLKMGHLKHFLILALLFGVTVFGFQNCSNPPDDQEVLSSVAATAPFAFDVQVDTLAHMSCGSMSGYDREAFFSYAAGAYDNGNGLKYTDAYIQHTGGLQPASRHLVLEQSPANNGAVVQIAVRNVANPSQIFSSAGGVVDGFAYGNFAQSLVNSSVALALPQSLGNARTRIFNGSPLYMRNDLLQSNANRLSRIELDGGGGFLAVSFGTDSFPSGPVTASNGNPYGRGFQMDFVRPGHISSGDENIVSAVREFDLVSGNQIRTWSCSSSLRYLIVDNRDAGVNYICGANLTPGVEETPANSAQAAELAELRKFLPVSKWGVDLARRCVVPKQGVAGLCYGGSTTIRYPGATTTCNGALNTCPHYVSICKR